MVLAHNLKVTGSNPVPATKSGNDIKELNVERFACVWVIAKRVNAKSTFDESPLKRVSVRPDCPAALIVGEIVSALNGGHYGVAGGASNEAALVG